jgi:hypothetical protein
MWTSENMWKMKGLTEEPCMLQAAAMIVKAAKSRILQELDM